METFIRILHLEDDPADAELVKATLAENGLSCRVTLAQTRDEFETALRNGGMEIILSDYRLPMYDGMSALRLAMDVCPDTPFIFVSGVMGEEVAIEALTRGATDYVLKQNLVRLASAIKRALQEAENLRDRRQAKEALQHSNDLLRAIIDSAPVAIIGLNLDGHVHSVWNSAAEKMLGWSAQDVMGRPLPSVPADQQEDFGRLHEQIRSGITVHGVEVRQQKRDGTLIDCSLYASPLYDAEGRVSGNIAVLVDITEHKQAEESIRKLFQAVDQSPASIVITDVSGGIEFVNRTFTQITGYTADEAIGQSLGLLQSGQTPAEKYTRLWQTISSGKVWRGELQNRKKNGELFWEQATIAGVRDADGVITHYVAVKDDITERKLLEEQFRQSQKLEAVGQLAGGIAHDFNNMLGVIIGHAEMVLESAKLNDSLHMNLEQILAAGRRSADITRQLLAFARKQTIAPKLLDLNETVEGMLKLLRRLIGEDIDLAWLPGSKLWPVTMDPSQIDQILANLCVNARDAISGVGNVTIETQKTTFDDAYCARHEGFSPGEYVMLAVSDDGCGMDKATLDRVFEPFFTTKEVGKGTGMGLATVYGIVKQNAGFIYAYSEPGIGSTFKIYLPRQEVTSDQKVEADVERLNLRGNETILLVEDDIWHLGVVKLMLETYGYRVLSAPAPEVALLTAKEHMGKIHLLLTDMIMPGMNGRDLAKEITSLDPEIICLFMSGYTSDVIVHHGIPEEGIHFIQKPFLKQDLATKVRENLDSIKVESKKTTQ